MNPIEISTAYQNFINASEKFRNVHNEVVEMHERMRSDVRDFYYRLALLMGGVLSLSITYIGFLASKSIPIHFTELLFLSWIFLLLSLIGATYRNHFNLDMGHYQTQNTRAQAMLEKYEASLVLAKISPSHISELSTKDEANSYIATTKKEIDEIKQAIESNERKEKKNSRLWIISQRCAHIGFAIGLTFMVAFAALNLPVKTEFTLLNMFHR